MGFRSTLTAQDHHGIVWPEWFRERYGLWLDEAGRLSVATERKVYSPPFDGLPQDLQRALAEAGWFDRYRSEVGYTYVWLHECGGITLVQVWPDRIVIVEPTDWEAVEYPAPPDGQMGSHEEWHNPHSYFGALVGEGFPPSGVT